MLPENLPAAPQTKRVIHSLSTGIAKPAIPMLRKEPVMAIPADITFFHRILWVRCQWSPQGYIFSFRLPFLCWKFRAVWAPRLSYILFPLRQVFFPCLYG